MNRKPGLTLLLALLPALSFPADPGKIRFSAVGDVMLSRDVAARMRKDGPDAPFSGISPLLKRHDLAFCNLEGVISRRGSPSRSGFLFRSHPDSLVGLLASGFNLVSLANNHSNDYGPSALLDTRDFLSAHGFHHAGTGANAWEALEPAILEQNGLRIAFFAFRETPFRSGKPRDPQPAAPDSQAIRSCLSAARAQADIVLVSYHWGEEFRRDPTAFQKRYAEIAIDAGADLILGHGSHALQPVAKYKGKYVFYGLGNCIFDQEYPMAKESLMLSCTLSAHAVTDLALTPLSIRACRPEPASGKDFARILAALRKVCAGSGIGLKRRGSEILLQ